MRNTSLLVMTVAVVLSLTACNKWNDADEYTYPVFSDDGVGVAVVHLTYKERKEISTYKKKDFHLQVLMKENLNSNKPSALTPVLDGTVKDLFYMRSNGYLVLGRSTNWLGSVAGGETGTIHYEKIDMDGTITPIIGGTYPIALSCDGGQSYTSLQYPIRVVPSPNGQVLALFESTNTCTERVETVSFLNADDLSLLDGPFDVPNDGPDTTTGFGISFPPVAMGWTVEGAFAVAHWGQGPSFEEYWATLFRPAFAPQTDVTVGLSCLEPATTSSDINASAQWVSVDEDNGTIAISTTSPNGPMGLGPASTAGQMFGCAP